MEVQYTLGARMVSVGLYLCDCPLSYAEGTLVGEMQYMYLAGVCG